MQIGGLLGWFIVVVAVLNQEMRDVLRKCKYTRAVHVSRVSRRWNAGLFACIWGHTDSSRSHGYLRWHVKSIELNLLKNQTILIDAAIRTDWEHETDSSSRSLYVSCVYSVFQAELNPRPPLLWETHVCVSCGGQVVRSHWLWLSFHCHYRLTWLLGHWFSSLSPHYVHQGWKHLSRRQQGKLPPRFPSFALIVLKSQNKMVRGMVLCSAYCPGTL